MDLEHFKEDYLKMKQIECLTDAEIADRLFIHVTTLYEYKKLLNIQVGKRPRKNSVGLPEEMLQRGEKIGLSRYLMCKRVRVFGWDFERAVTEPNNGVGRKRK